MNNILCIILSGFLLIGCNSKDNKTSAHGSIAIEEEFINIDIDNINEHIRDYSSKLNPTSIMKMHYSIEVSGEEGNQTISVMTRKLEDGKIEVELIHNNLLDDSIQAEKHIMELIKVNDIWNVLSLKKNWKCWENRGHTNWGIENCI